MDYISNEQTKQLLSTYKLTTERFEQLESAFRENNPALQYVLIELNEILSGIEKLINLEDESFYITALYQIEKEIKSQVQKLTKCEPFSPVPLSDGFIDDTGYFSASTTSQNFANSHDNILENNFREHSEKNDKMYDTIQSLKTEPLVRGLNEIAGMASIKKMLKSIVILPLYQPQLFLGRKHTNCILLYGPPGTGKTRLAHAMAAESKAELYCIAASDILGKYVGHTEKMLQEIFKFARHVNYHIILFIDEIDGLCQHRTDDEKPYIRRLKTELMTQLSNFETYRNAILICATNCPWDLDTAFIRRFQKRIYIPLPDRLERLEILKLYTKDTNLENCTQHLERILDRTEGYSGSDLSNLVTHALEIPIYELQEAKVWRLIDNQFYTPIGQTLFSEQVICSDVHELPPNSVVARQVDSVDLLLATDQVEKSVTDKDIEKYKKYKASL